MNALTETRWLEGLVHNDPRTVRGLYTRHFPTVRQYVLENNGTVADAEDMFQEAFMALWLRVKEGKFQATDGQGPGGFLFQVAKNKWLDVVRSAGKRQMRVLKHIDQTAAEVVDHATEERLARLREVYGLLDAKCRKVLDQFYFERQDLAAIAKGMGVEEESIRTIKYRCMMKLRAYRAKIGGENSGSE